MKEEGEADTGAPQVAGMFMVAIGPKASPSFLSNGRFQFKKRRQLFVRTHNEKLSVAAMCVCNPDCSPLGIMDGPNASSFEEC